MTTKVEPTNPPSVTEAQQRHAQAQYDKQMRSMFRYYILDGTAVADDDGDARASYVVYGAQANSQPELWEQLGIEVVGSDGESTKVIAFSEAPRRVQEEILRLLGLTWERIE